MKQLIIKNDGLGDLILTSGVIASLADEFDGETTLVTCEENAEIAEKIPGLKRVVYVSREFSMETSFNFADNRAKRIIRQTNFDRALVLRRFVRKSTLDIMKLVKSREKIACWEFPTNISESQAYEMSRDWNLIADPSGPLWEPEYYSHVFGSHLNVTIDSRPRLHMKQVSHESVSKSIGLVVSGTISRWPDENWHKLSEAMQGEGIHIKVFGGDESRKLKESLSRNFPKAAFFGKNNDLDTIARELGSASLVVGNDTGLTHLANLVNHNVITILGGGTAGRFFPWPHKEGNLVHVQPMPCFDCDWRCIYSDKKCLTALRADPVIDASITFIRKTLFPSSGVKTVLLVEGWKRGIGTRPTVQRVFDRCI